MRRTDPIPTDWKQRVETCIQSCKFLFLPEDKKPKERRLMMLKLLRGRNVQAGAEILWNLAGNLSLERLQEVRRNFHAHIASALFVLAMALRSRPPGPSAKPLREIAEALEQVRDSRRFFQGEPERKELERAIRFYRWAEKCARKTKPKDVGLRIALCCLRSDFRLVFGSPVSHLDDAVGFFMQEAFGGQWGAATVRARASEWGRPRKQP